MAADVRSDLDRSSTSVSITAGNLSRVRVSVRTIPLAITPDLIDKGMGIPFLTSVNTLFQLNAARVNLARSTGSLDTLQ